MVVVAVIGDSPELRSSMIELMETRGWDMQRLAHPDDALLGLADDCPDVLVVDVEAETAQDWFLLSQLRRAVKDLPLIAVCSFHSSTAWRERLQEIGAYATFEPIVDPDDLVQAVEAVLCIPRAPEAMPGSYLSTVAV